MNKEKCKLSVAITNYNELEWIEEAVDSVLNQNLPYPYEVLIGDDGSNDGSYELICDKYGNLPNVRIFRQSRDPSVKEFPNWRHSRLFFRLYDEAKGEYIAFLDGDDYYCDTECMKRRIEILDSPENRECVACYGKFYYLRGTGLIKGCEDLDDLSEGKYCWLGYPHTALATAVVRRKALSTVPRAIYYEEFCDWTTTVWLAHIGKFYFYPDRSFVYRQRENSIWRGTKNKEKAIRAMICADLDTRVYGHRIVVFRPERNAFDDLYFHKDFAQEIDYEMWNSFAKKYKAKVSLMLLNREEMNGFQRVWLSVFRRLLHGKEYRQKVKGYVIGAVSILNPKISLDTKKKLFTNWFRRIRKR